MSRQCAFCGEVAADPTRIALDLKRGAVSIHIDGIPARHCSACGSDGVDGPLAEEISEGAQRITLAIEAAIATPAPPSEAQATI